MLKWKLRISNEVCPYRLLRGYDNPKCNLLTSSSFGCKIETCPIKEHEEEKIKKENLKDGN